VPQVQQQASAPRAVVENIEAILRLEEAALQSRTVADRLADLIGSLIGRMGFVAFHFGALAAWVVVNARLVSWPAPFDPFPFPLLSLLLSTESVLVAVFVLMKQNRMSYLSDRRSHLDLQVNLLTEREVTRVLQIIGRIERHLGIEPEGGDGHGAELSEETEVAKLVATLDDKLGESR